MVLKLDSQYRYHGNVYVHVILQTKINCIYMYTYVVMYLYKLL